MECQYFMSVGGEPKPKRKSPKSRRSPLDQVVLSVHAAKRTPPTQLRRDVQAYLLSLGNDFFPVAGGELGELVSNLLNCTRDMGSYYVSRAIEDKVLVMA